MPDHPTAITIGNFDGVHIGHTALVRRCRELAGNGGKVVVLAFDPHPMTKLRPQVAPPRLTTFEQRTAWLREAGADEVARLTPDDTLLGKTPGQFVDWLRAQHSPRWIVEGADFHFGKGRAGNVEVLRTLGQKLGFECDVVGAVEVALTDQLMARASSSLVRWLLSHGRVRDAAIVLGRPYELAGTVVQGDRRGRTIGFPTANIATEQLLPADGVYAAEVVLPSGRRTAGAFNVGSRPTFNGTGRRAEVHVLGASGNGNAPEWAPLDGLPEYGWPIAVRLIAWIRDDVRFDGVATLVDQIRRDCERTRRLVGEAVPS